jgi:proline iminopeptidase
MNASSVPPFEHGRGEHVPTATGSVYIEVEGEGPPVLLASGGPGVSHVHYHPWFSRLARHHTVVYYDHPGVGRSSRRADGTSYTLTAYAQAIEAVRRHLAAETIGLIGVSFGGLPAIEYACSHPTRVRRLVMSNAAYSARSWQLGNIDSVNHELATRYPELWQRLLTLRGDGVRSLAPEYQEIMAGALPDLEWRTPAHRPMLTQPTDVREEYVAEAYEAFFGPDPELVVGGTVAGYEPAVATIAEHGVPSLIATGRHDRVTPVVVAHVLRQALGEQNSRLIVLENSAHRPWAEEPERYFAELDDFLR